MAIVEFRQEDNFEELQNTLSQLKEEGEKIITNVLHNEGASEIIEGIRPLIPESGKEWKKRKVPAKKASKPIRYRKNESGNLNVIVGTTNDYNYLYFPDDGERTKYHEGNQQFMRKGAENKAGKILDICMEQLTKKINQKGR